MAKTKTRWICQQCGFMSMRSLGRCTDCGGWSTLVEEITQEDDGSKKGFAARVSQLNNSSRPESENKALPLSQIDTKESGRISTGLAGLDEVLGGGLVPGA